MANFEALNDEAMEAASGGAAKKANTNTTNWQGALFLIAPVWQWQRPAAAYVPAAVAQPTATPAPTIIDINKIYAGDAIIIRRA